jgi:MarR family transcriptional regulator, transcriptional regulator for hemolysin
MSADLDDDLLILLSDVVRHMHTFGDQLAQAHGITRAQLIILARLERQPDLTQNELAALAEVTSMTIARLIDRLESLGLVERCVDPEDRRVWRLRLTSEAAPFLRAVKNLRTVLHATITEGIEPTVLRTMALGLRRMKQNLSQCRSSGPIADARRHRG